MHVFGLPKRGEATEHTLQVLPPPAPTTAFSAAAIDGAAAAAAAAAVGCEHSRRPSRCCPMPDCRCVWWCECGPLRCRRRDQRRTFCAAATIREHCGDRCWRTLPLFCAQQRLLWWEGDGKAEEEAAGRGRGTGIRGGRGRNRGGGMTKESERRLEVRVAQRNRERELFNALLPNCAGLTYLPPRPRVQRTIKSSKNTVRTGVFVGHAVRYSINSVPKLGA